MIEEIVEILYAHIIDDDCYINRDEVLDGGGRLKRKIIERLVRDIATDIYNQHPDICRQDREEAIEAVISPYQHDVKSATCTECGRVESYSILTFLDVCQRCLHSYIYALKKENK